MLNEHPIAQTAEETGCRSALKSELRSKILLRCNIAQGDVTAGQQVITRVSICNQAASSTIVESNMAFAYTPESNRGRRNGSRQGVSARNLRP